MHAVYQCTSVACWFAKVPLLRHCDCDAHVLLEPESRKTVLPLGVPEHAIKSMQLPETAATQPARAQTQMPKWNSLVMPPVDRKHSDCTLPPQCSICCKGRPGTT
eukprot:2755295-Alexandrium_andersonii.AAC.1